MAGSIQKAFIAIGSGVLCLSALVGYDWGLFGSSDSLSVTMHWVIFGVGFLVTGGGLVVITLQLDKKRRRVLALLLLSFGIFTFVLALVIAHVGPPLIAFAFPAIVYSAMIGLEALPYQRR